MRKILVDCDGVMADFTPAYLNLLHDLTGRAHSVSEVTSFTYSECVSTPEEDAQIWEIIKRTPGFVRNLPALPGVADGLARLRELGEVVCVTSPVWGCSWADERYHWLLNYGFDKKSIVFASNKAHLSGDVLIDDHYKNLNEWTAAHPKGWPLLISQPWNWSATLPRVSSLLGAANVLRAR